MRWKLFGRRSTSRGTHGTRSLRVEHLEQRKLLTINSVVVNGILYVDVVGTSGNDTLTMNSLPSGNTHLQMNGGDGSFDEATVDLLDLQTTAAANGLGWGGTRLFGLAGNDILNGANSRNHGAHFDGGAGNDVAFGTWRGDSYLMNGGNDVINLFDQWDSITSPNTICGSGSDVVNFRVNNNPGASLTNYDCETVNGGAGNDFIDSTNFPQNSVNVTGGAGNDLLIGSNGNDTMSGNAGNDTIRGNDGNDIINGNGGNDSLSGNAGDDTMTGGGGNDVASGGAGEDDIFGNGGNDTLIGDSEGDSLFGGAGNDDLRGGLGRDTLAGGTGVDHGDFSDMPGSVTASLLAAEVANDGDGNQDQFSNLEGWIGSAQADSLTGDNGPNWISGGGGDDTLTGNGGDDMIAGNADNDVINGGSGNDTISGDGGADNASGGTGNDLISGGANDDTLNGNEGSDTINGNGGADVINGGDQNDVLFGDDGADNINGGAGADILDGGSDNDSLNGSSGIDLQFGDQGADQLTAEYFSGAGFYINDSVLLGLSNPLEGTKFVIVPSGPPLTTVQKSDAELELLGSNLIGLAFVLSDYNTGNSDTLQFA
jgi:Ca2+-binding RTX toxin-like protein